MTRLTTFCLVAFSIALPRLASAEPTDRPCAKGCDGMRHMRGPSFDTKTIETLEAEITDVQRIEHKHGIVGVHVTLKTEKESIEAHLGPTCFFDTLNLKPTKGQRVTVKGSRVKTMRGPALLVMDITIDGKTTTLRDGDGRPAWGTCK